MAGRDHVFKGEPDARQGPKDQKLSRFRKRYRRLEVAEIALMDEIKDKAAELEALYERIRQGRYRSLAFTDLEASVMWAVKEITG